MSTYRGTMFTREAPRGTQVSVSLGTTGMVVVGGDSRREFAYHNLEVSRGGYGDRMLVFTATTEEGPLSLYFEDHAIAEALRNYRLPPAFSTRLARAAGSGRRMKWFLFWAALVGGGALVVYLLVTWGFGAAVDVAVEHVPVEWEVELGRSAAKEQLTKWSVCSHPAVNQAVNAIGRRLVEAIDAPPYAFRFKVVDSPDMNAFALPAGYVFVNFGLLEQADTPDQVAGVLAHEIQHALCRHGLRNVLGQAGIGLLFGLFFGDMQGLGGLLAGGASELAALSFSREQEDEADALGLELIYRAQFDPDGMPQFFAKLKQEQLDKGIDLPSFLSTHPDTEQRIRVLREAIAHRGAVEIRPLEVDWEAARKECAPIPFSDPDREVTEVKEESPKAAAPGENALESNGDS